MSHTVFPKWRKSLMEGSKCGEMGCFGRSSNFEVEGGQHRWHQHRTKPRQKPPFESHSMWFVWSETIQSGQIKSGNNVWPLEKPNRIRIYESGEIEPQNRETSKKAKETLAKYVIDLYPNEGQTPAIYSGVSLSPFGITEEAIIPFHLISCLLADLIPRLLEKIHERLSLKAGQTRVEELILKTVRQ